MKRVSFLRGIYENNLLSFFFLSRVSLLHLLCVDMREQRWAEKQEEKFAEAQT